MDKEILSMLEKYNAAVWDKNKNDFLELHDTTIHSYDAWETWQYQGMEEYRVVPEEWFGNLGNDRVKVTFWQPIVHQTEHLATLWSYVVYAAFDPQDKFLRCLSNRMTMVLIRQTDGWKIIHEHTSVPVGFESGTGSFFNSALPSSVFEEPFGPVVIL